MPSFDLIPLLVQTGYAGLFIALLIYVLRDTRSREIAWTREREERHEEFMRIHEEHLKMQRETLQVVNSLKLVIQQWMDESKPPFTDWNGEERRKTGRRAHNG